MQSRSPVILWLLLAATISVDLAAYAGFVSDPHGGFWIVTYDVLFGALIEGQLSILVIWSTLRTSKTFWTRIVPWLAAIVAALVIGLFGYPPLKVGLPYYGLHAGLLYAALWLLERTPFWRRRTGAIAEWRYSVAHLLLIMTIVAVLATATRNNQWFDRDGGLNTAFICGSVALAIVSVISWSFSQSQHWLMPLAVVLGFAILIGTAFIKEQEPFMPLYLGADYLVQGIVLSAWIGIGQILPRSNVSPSATKQD